MWNKKNLAMAFSQVMFGFSSCTVGVLLSPYFLNAIHYSEEKTLMIIGAFTAIGRLFSVVGGFIGDKYLGAYRSLVLSFVGFTVGYGLLMLGAVSLNLPLSLVGITLASCATGLFLPNYPTLFQTTFASQEMFQKAYTINYSINNIGALIGQYFFPFLVTGIVFGSSFTLAGIGFKGCFMWVTLLCAFALVVLLLFRKKLLSHAHPIDKESVSLKNWGMFSLISAVMLAIVFFMFGDMYIGQYIIYAICFISIAYFIYLMIQSPASIALRMGTILIMLFLTTAFFTYYVQMITSMNIVAINTMRGDLFGFIPIKAEGSIVMNPLWCVIAGPVIAKVINYLEKRQIFLSTATKVGISFIFTAIAFSILTISVFNIGSDVILPPEVFFFVHCFQAFGEVIIGSLVVAFILSVVPKKIAGFSVSLFMMAMALGGVIGAVFSTAVAIEKGGVLTQALAVDKYGHFFMMITILAAAMVVVAFFASFVINKMLKKADELERIENVA